jgi:hypothetical protein
MYTLRRRSAPQRQEDGDKSSSLPHQYDDMTRRRLNEALQDAQETGARLQHLALLDLYGPPQVCLVSPDVKQLGLHGETKSAPTASFARDKG